MEKEHIKLIREIFSDKHDVNVKDKSNRLIRRIKHMKERGLEVMTEIVEKIDALGIRNCKMQIRTKSTISTLYHVLREENIDDFYAIRLIVDTTEECYIIRDLLCEGFKCVEERTKDFIGSPKENGYQSLHLTLKIEDDTRFEVQIRTSEMHGNAEYGNASHYGYNRIKWGDESLALIKKLPLFIKGTSFYVFDKEQVRIIIFNEFVEEQPEEQIQEQAMTILK